jgi:hypothetical protein
MKIKNQSPIVIIEPWQKTNNQLSFTFLNN